MKKLDLLIDQQAAFSQEVNQLKSEIQNLQSDEVVNSESTVTTSTVIEPPTQVDTSSEEFPDYIDVDSFKRSIEIYDIGITSGGNAFISFDIISDSTLFPAFFSSNGNWMVKNDADRIIAKGRFEQKGKVLVTTEGAFKGKQFRNKDIIENLIEAAGLSPSQSLSNGEPEVSKTDLLSPSQPRTKSNLERYIGENLITVIGIIIVLIGVVFGVKYSIDHNLISPLMRIMLSYVLGIGVLVTGIKLKKKYEQFSAVLVSGAMAIMYVVTYIAYSMYDIFPQLVTFAIMVLFTIFTVVAAISYNKQIIAHIGLVGSYAVPFLLSNDSGNVTALFIFMTIINTGILVIAFKKHWKPLYYLAFGCTWAIYLLWFVGDYKETEHFAIGLLFASLFFLMFYCTFLAYKLIEKEKFAQEDVMMIVLNSAIFYGFGYVILDQSAFGTHYVGLFTVATALIHFIVSVILFKSKLADRNLFYLSSGMVLVFLTIAVPVQLDGNWVTLLWGTEAALLFWIGRTKDVRFYEVLSYIVMGIALVSLFEDYSRMYIFGHNLEIEPFKNAMFMTTAIISAAYGFILYINTREKYGKKLRTSNPAGYNLLTTGLTVVLIGLVYNMFRMEFDILGNQMYVASLIKEPNPAYDMYYFDYIYAKDILFFKNVWILNYTLVFASVLAFINIKRIQNVKLGKAIILINTALVFIFLVFGLYELSELRSYYINQTNSEFYTYTSYNVIMRYITYLFAAGSIYTIYRILKEHYSENKMIKMTYDLLKHLTILWVLCSELINLMDLSGHHDNYKLALSILSGLYAILLVALGIWKRKQYLRIAAISLFGITLLKLFFYDMARSTTIAKTVVFITLGIILLIISFMYNKYKHLIIDEKE
ncbi:MAG: DUF2339 domain-containing protein [Crocinitomicaceae bacterium]|nr:DUF2339 domain-containing protein [Crocinitomicaceae bacterium]